MAPSLAEVLAQGGAAAHPSLNPLVLLAGVSVFLLGAYSAVKGLDLYRRRRLIPAILNETAPLAERKDNEEIEKLSFMVDEIKSEKETLAGQNRELQGKIMELSEVLCNVKQTRDTLEKSNLVLAKESARLKGEREELVLKASTPLIAVKTEKTARAKQAPVKAVKTKTAATKAAKTAKTKKGDRKPKRVSRKAK